MLRIEVPLGPLTGTSLADQPWSARDGDVFVGITGPAVRELNVWRRLVQSEGARATVLLSPPGWKARDLDSARSLFPRSEHDKVVVLDAALEDWSGVSSFGMVWANGRANALVLGPPGEEDWDRFREFVLASIG